MLLSVATIKCLGKISKSQGVHGPGSLHPPPQVSWSKYSSCKLWETRTPLKTLSVCGIMCYSTCFQPI